jgi:hypothetical protein
VNSKKASSPHLPVFVSDSADRYGKIWLASPPLFAPADDRARGPREDRVAQTPIVVVSFSSPHC